VIEKVTAEGDTLVVETAGFNERSFIDACRRRPGRSRSSMSSTIRSVVRRAELARVIGDRAVLEARHVLPIGGLSRRRQRQPDRRREPGCSDGTRSPTRPVLTRSGSGRSYSITLSAIANSVSGNVICSALAVTRLRTNSSFAVCCTGRSAGFSPFKTRPA
jgi:hypothetical protein